MFNISPDNIIIDELHLMLRVTDRLEHSLILEVIDWDEVCDFTHNRIVITQISNKYIVSLLQKYIIGNT